MPSTKKPTIELSPRVILTDSGVGFFMNKGHKLSKISMADDTVQYGVKMAAVSPQSFQHMLRIGYISSLEVARPEFTTIRSDLMDFSKLIVYGILYRHFDQVIFDQLLNSALIKEWNRSNPSNIIDERTKINDGFLQDALAKNADKIKAMRRAIADPILRSVADDITLQADEKNAKIFMTDRFLDHTRPFVWFILMRFSSSPHHKALLDEVRSTLDLYIRRSRIADYLTLLLMELAISAETINLTAFGERTYGKEANIPAMLYDPAKREELLKAMEKARADLTVAWRIGNPHSSSIGNDRKMELSIYNREAGYQELKEQVEEKMKSGAGVSIGQFYQTGSAGNSQMGLLYLGYLQEECDKVGMRFSSRVSEARSGVPLITLKLQF